MGPLLLTHEELEDRPSKSMQDHKHQKTTYAASPCQIADRNDSIQGKCPGNPANFTSCQIESRRKNILHIIL